MMDIVKRLRNNKGGESYTWKTINEAADEIERLREELKRVNDGIDAFERSIKWKHDNWLKFKLFAEQNLKPLDHKYEDIPSRYSYIFDKAALKEDE
jgi:hypothetical protein